MQTADRSWRWTEGGLAALVWFVPITGLTRSVLSVDRVLSSLLIGLVVGTVASVPLPSLQARMIKTATAKRVVEAVWTAAAGAAVLALLDLDGRSFVSVTIGLICLWGTLAISIAVRPLSISEAGIGRDAVAFLPVPKRSPMAARGKRAFDLIVATLTILAVAPVLVVVAAAIKANDRGPVLFKQQRIGRNGVPFEMLKFRSMVINAEDLKAELATSSERSGPLFKLSNDPRVTPIGRVIRELSIDELPQLINILRGDMSLVGPRPALPDEAAQFDTILERRNVVTPGLTGLWQAEARSDADFERFRELDLRYVSTASPALDFWIILATATEVMVAAAALPLSAMGCNVGQTDGIETASNQTIDLRAPADALGSRQTAV